MQLQYYSKKTNKQKRVQGRLRQKFNFSLVRNLYLKTSDNYFITDFLFT